MGFHQRADEYGEILHFTVGVAFLGTPFRGSWKPGHIASDPRIEVAIGTGCEHSRELIQYLRPTSDNVASPLDELVTRFCEMVNHKNFKFGIVCVYETRDTNFSAIRRKLPEGYAEEKLDANGHGIVCLNESQQVLVANTYSLYREAPPALMAQYISAWMLGTTCYTNSMTPIMTASNDCPRGSKNLLRRLMRFSD